MGRGRAVWESHLSLMTTPKEKLTYIILSIYEVNSCQKSIKWTKPYYNSQFVWQPKNFD